MNKLFWQTHRFSHLSGFEKPANHLNNIIIYDLNINSKAFVIDFEILFRELNLENIFLSTDQLISVRIFKKTAFARKMASKLPWEI